MKKNIALLTLVLVFGMSVGPASAANSLQKHVFGMNIGVDDEFMVQGKYFVADRVAVLAGAGLAFNSGDADGTDIALRGGGRYYLRADDLAPFVGGFVNYSSTQDSNLTVMEIMGEFGAEYFLAKQFSIEGSARVGVTVTDNDTTGYNATTLGTSRAGFSLNYYF